MTLRWRWTVPPWTPYPEPEASLSYAQRPHPGAFWSSLTPGEAARLAELSRGRLCLEVGAAFGFSTVAVARDAAHVTSVDLHRSGLAPGGTLSDFRQNLRFWGVSRKVTPLVQWAHVAL